MDDGLACELAACCYTYMEETLTFFLTKACWRVIEYETNGLEKIGFPGSICTDCTIEGERTFHLNKRRNRSMCVICYARRTHDVDFIAKWFGDCLILIGFESFDNDLEEQAIKV